MECDTDWMDWRHRAHQRCLACVKLGANLPSHQVTNLPDGQRRNGTRPSRSFAAKPLRCSQQKGGIMAIAIRRLPPEEAQRVFPRRSQHDVSEYVKALRELEPGDAAAIERQGLSDRAIKRRLGEAAQQLGYRLKWSRQSDPDQLYFQTVATSATQVVNGRRRRRTPTSEAARGPEPATPRTGRGRRRKVA